MEEIASGEPRARRTDEARRAELRRAAGETYGRGPKGRASASRRRDVGTRLKRRNNDPLDSELNKARNSVNSAEGRIPVSARRRRAVLAHRRRAVGTGFDPPFSLSSPNCRPRL